MKKHSYIEQIPKCDWEYYTGEVPEVVERHAQLLRFEDEMNRFNGNVVADTIGADYCFFEGFLNDDMSLDFPWIAKDFLQHCYHKLDGFDVKLWYGVERFACSTPKRAIQLRILTLIYNGAKSHNEYCVELIKYLYKTYHKREYKQLKRFRSITVPEIMAFVEDDDKIPSFFTLGRILGVCPMFGIELEERCSFFYILLDKIRKESLAEADYGEDDFDQNMFDECIEQVDAWVAEHEKGKRLDRHFKVYRDIDRFVGKCLYDNGYPDDYVYGCLDFYRGTRLQLARTLRLLKLTYPSREFNYEEVQRYAQVYTLASAVANISDTCDFEFQNMFEELEAEYDGDEAILFHPEEIRIKNKPMKISSVEQRAVQAELVSLSNVPEERYVAEVAELRASLNRMEKENRHLQEVYRNSKIANLENENLIRKYEDERAELISLREFVYNLEVQEEVPTKESAENMQRAIADQRIVLVGGHVKWVKKLQSIFPKWVYVHEDVSRNFDSKVLEGAKKVYFFTDYLSHRSYGRIISIVREHRIPFGYLANLNVEKLVQQVYEETV